MFNQAVAIRLSARMLVDDVQNRWVNLFNTSIWPLLNMFETFSARYEKKLEIKGVLTTAAKTIFDLV